MKKIFLTVLTSLSLTGAIYADASISYEEFGSMVFVHQSPEEHLGHKTHLGFSEDDFVGANGHSQVDLDLLDDALKEPTSLEPFMLKDGVIQKAKNFGKGFIQTLLPWNHASEDLISDFEVIEHSINPLTGTVYDLPTAQEGCQVEQVPFWKQALTKTAAGLTEGDIVDNHANMMLGMGTTAIVGVALSPLWFVGASATGLCATACLAGQAASVATDWVPGGKGAVKKQLFRATDTIRGWLNF
jgi:hypothetical protein